MSGPEGLYVHSGSCGRTPKHQINVRDVLGPGPTDCQPVRFLPATAFPQLPYGERLGTASLIHTLNHGAVSTGKRGVAVGDEVPLDAVKRGTRQWYGRVARC